MQNLSDIDLVSRAKMTLMKGGVGVGKSVAAASYPKPMFICDFDRRIASIRKLFPHEKEIYFETYTSYKKFAEDFDRICDSAPYKTVVLDSLTNLVELIIDYFVKLRGGTTLENMEEEAEENRKQKKKGKMKGILSMTTIEDYSAETRALSEILVNSKVLAERKVNIILTAHIITTVSTNIKTGSNTIEKFLLTYGKKAAGKIPTVFDEIYHFSTKSSIDTSQGLMYEVNTSNDGDDFARSSFHLPSSINWTDKNFYNEIFKYFSIVKDSPMEEVPENLGESVISVNNIL